MQATIYDIVQFVPEHKWGGCFGFVNEKKDCGDDVRYMIGVPVPQGGTAYIFSMESAEEFEVCERGIAIFVPGDADAEEN